MTPTPHLVPLIVFPALVLIAAIKDATSFTIPNWISGLAAVAFLGAAMLIGAPAASVAIAVGVGVLALLLGIVLFSVGWIGGGDAKLMSACALWMGWPAALAFLFWTAASGGVLALVLLIGRRLSRRRLDRAPPWLRGLMAENGDVPYGIAIAAGAIAAFPASVLVRRGL